MGAATPLILAMFLAGCGGTEASHAQSDPHAGDPCFVNGLVTQACIEAYRCAPGQLGCK